VPKVPVYSDPVVPILVFNAGSSTLKYRLLPAGPGEIIEVSEGHGAAVEQVLERLPGKEIRAVGHRVVHGGARFVAPVRLDDAVLDAIREVSVLAPLHNPAAVAGIEAARRALPDVPQFAVFDTAFHATLPPSAYLYALDRAVADRYAVRRYGFHGISVRWVAAAAARLLERPLDELNLIVLHLGNGASATAVAGGRSVETSMGMTPLEGLVMGTRTGDLDPAVTFHLLRAGLSAEDVEDLYQHHGGLLGLCGTGDVRTVQSRTDEDARLALDVYCHRIRKYVGAYHAVLGRVDAIVFTAGVGEHSAAVRAGALAGLDPMGIAVDPARNEAGAGIISPAGARVAVCVVPTDEERAIAEEIAPLL
jgi:acetate kinase